MVNLFIIFWDFRFGLINSSIDLINSYLPKSVQTEKFEWIKFATMFNEKTDIDKVVRLLEHVRIQVMRYKYENEDEDKEEEFFHN